MADYLLMQMQVFGHDRMEPKQINMVALPFYQQNLTIPGHINCEMGLGSQAMETNQVQPKLVYHMMKCEMYNQWAVQMQGNKTEYYTVASECNPARAGDVPLTSGFYPLILRDSKPLKSDGHTKDSDPDDIQDFQIPVLDIISVNILENLKNGKFYWDLDGKISLTLYQNAQLYWHQARKPKEIPQETFSCNTHYPVGIEGHKQVYKTNIYTQNLAKI
uniref:Uncharacterized protein n=1 Tax=Romanomermis culicivorax TaxID=13658 RepID=A0A915KX36_ROMCU